MIEDYVDITVTDNINVINITPSVTEEVVDINISDNREDVSINVTESIIEVNINKVTNVLSATWGSITGVLSNQTDLQTALDAKVPYTGATGNVNLGEWGAKVGYLGFDTTPTGTPTGIGTTYWDAFNRTLALIDGDGDTTLQIGQEERILVHNNTGSTLTDGQVVYITGSTGELPSVALSSNTSVIASTVTLGVVTESITNGSDGFITTSGIVHGLNTLAFTEGAALWLGSTAGTFTETKPTAPAHSVLIGYVVKHSGGNGSIYVKIQNGSELDELHNVLITSVANNQGLFYESSTSLWKNKSISTILGYTPISLSSLSASSPLSYNSSTGAFSIQVANTSQNGYLSSTDWNTFNSKAAALSGTINTLTYWASSTTIGSLALATYPSLTEISYVKGVTSAIQTQLNGKQATLTNPITGTGTANYVSKFNGTGTSITNSLIYDNGTIGINTTSPTAGVVLTLQESASLGSALSLLNRNSTQNWKIAVDVAAVDDKYLAFIDTTTATAKMVIGQNGNVGIGNTTPTVKLDISYADNSGSYLAGIKIKNTLNSTVSQSKIDIYNSSDNLISLGQNSALVNGGVSFLATSATDLVFSPSYTERMRIVTSTGNVGIGTTAPSSKLQVIANMAGWAGWIENQESAGNGSGLVITGGTNAGGISLFVRKQDGTGTFAVMGTGNVGIGTTSPSQKLTIGDGTGTGNQYLRVNSLNSDIYIGQSGSGLFGLAANAAQNIVGDNPYYPLAIGTTAAQSLIFGTTNTERLRITSSGNVGIGTTAPTSKLHVSGLPSYVNNAAAITGGLTAGAFYYTNVAGDGVLKVVI